VRRLLVRGACAAIVASVLPVLLLRWIPPIATPFMIGRWLDGVIGRQPPVRIEYDWVPWTRIAATAPLAVVAAEDQRFPTHYGFDVGAIRKAWHERRTQLRGASTITQQTARNLFLWSGHSWPRKVLEAYATLLIEACWPKRRILEVYLNVAEFGDGVYGIEAASQRFFGHGAAQLSRHEAALLAAVLPDPKDWRAVRPSAFVDARAQHIESQMAHLGPAYLASL
jgi:monofunctional biosynthetic peptidoglycan transglycosylase